MTIWFELKKLMACQKGLWVVLGFCLLSLGLLWATDTPADRAQAQAGEEYEFWVGQLSGPLDDAKKRLIQDTSLAVSNAHIALAGLRRQYEAGALSQKEYEQGRQAAQKVLATEKGFLAVYDQYRYIAENPENRWFVATNGWAALLGPDLAQAVLLMAALLLLTVPVFCGEYSAGMDQIALAAPNGGACLGAQKPLLAILLALLLALWQFAAKAVFLGLRYGLPHPAYPLQSLPAFGSCTRALSLGQAAALLAAARLLGAALFAAFILLASVFLRAAAVTAFAAAAVGVLPCFALPESLLYRLPLPGAFLLGSGFLQGSRAAQDELGREQTLFQELSMREVGLLFVAALLCLAAALAVIRRKNANVWGRKGGWG